MSSASRGSDNQTRGGEDKPFPIIRKPVPISESGPLRPKKPRSSRKQPPILTNRVSSDGPGHSHRDNPRKPPSANRPDLDSELDFLDLDDSAPWISEPARVPPAASYTEEGSSKSRFRTLFAVLALLLIGVGAASFLRPQLFADLPVAWLGNLFQGSNDSSDQGAVAGQTSTGDASTDTDGDVVASLPPVIPRSESSDSEESSTQAVEMDGAPGFVSPLNNRFREQLELLENLIESGSIDEAEQALIDMDRRVYGYGAPEFRVIEDRIAQLRSSPEAAQQEAERLAEERAAAEALAAQQEAERLAEERAAAEALAAQQEAERLAEERAAAEALAAQQEAQRLAEERAAAEALAAQQEAQRLAEERAAAEALAAQQEAQRLAEERAAAEALAAQQAAELEIASLESAGETDDFFVSSQDSNESQIAETETELPQTITDDDLQLVYARFDQLQNAIRERDIEAVIALTDRSVVRIQQFLQMFQNNVSIDARIKNVSTRNSQGEIQGTLVITRLERADGVVTGPPPDLASVTLTSNRSENGWSVIKW